MSETLDTPKPTEGSVASLRLRPFVIESRQPESEVITSFVLRPSDGLPIAPHIAGQHLTLLAQVPGLGEQKRNYTISAKPNGATYRISVKREDKGTVSRWLHDRAKIGTPLIIGTPSGDFVLPADASTPIVFLSGGVGVTPMVSMLEAIAEQNSDRSVHFIHCTSNASTHAFGEHVRNLAAAHPNIHITIFYGQPRQSDAAGRDYDHAGRIDMDWLLANTPVADAEYFVCGPLGFLRTYIRGLLAAGVATDRVHYEFFGPVEDLMDDASGAGPARPPATAPGAAYTAGIAAGSTLTRDAIAGAILDSAADAVVASDREGMIVLWNAGAARVFGFSEQEALGQSLDIIIPEPFRARHWEGYHETVGSGVSRYGAGDLLAVPGLRKDGSRISVEFTIALLNDSDDKVSGMVAILRDVTERFNELKRLRKEVAAQSPA